MAKKSTMSKADKSTVKAIKAFNERLRYARRKYGVESEIVEDMINQARHVVKLRWIRDRTGEEVISTGKENLGVLKYAWEREEFNRYISNNSARNLLNASVYTRDLYRKGLKGLRGKAKTEAEERFYKDYKFMVEMYNLIWKDVYEQTEGDSNERRERANRCYTAAKHELQYSTVKMYSKGKLDVHELVEILDYGTPLDIIIKRKYGNIQPSHPQTKADKDNALNEIATHDDYFDTNNDDYFDTGSSYFDDFGSD